MIEGIFGRDFTVIERAMDVRMARHQMLSSDVANIDTPGFRALDVDFRESLDRMMAFEDAMAASLREAPQLGATQAAEEADKPALSVTGIDGLFVGPDSNSANLELLMGRVQENTSQYRVAADMISYKFRRLHQALEAVSKA